MQISEEIIAQVKEVVMIVRHFVNNPDDVDVKIQCNGKTLVAYLNTNPDDVGQAIGRNAHLISSIRSLLSAIQGKNNIRVMLIYATEDENKRKIESQRRRAG